MGENFISLFSLTYAYKAKDLLIRNHISCRIVPTPKSMKKSGCGYSLAVSGDLRKALLILEQAGIRIANVQKSIH